MRHLLLLCAVGGAGAVSLWQHVLRGYEADEGHGTCGHIRFEDIAFLADFLKAEGVDATPEGWAKERLRIMNLDDSRCVSAPETSAASERRKTFGLGLSKTGTTSLNNALLDAGFDNADMADSFWPKVVDASSKEDAAAFLEARGAAARGATAVARKTRALFAGKKGSTDLPVAAFADELLAAYPDALFILTTRDPADWARSAYQQFTRPPRGDVINRNREVAFGADIYVAHLYRKRFLEHYARMLRLVPCCQLLVMDVVAGQGWEKLGPFLNLDPEKTPKGTFPYVSPGLAGQPDLSKRRVVTDAAHAKADVDGNGFLSLSELVALLHTMPPPKTARKRQTEWTEKFVRQHWEKANAGTASALRDERGLDPSGFFRFCLRLGIGDSANGRPSRTRRSAGARDKRSRRGIRATSPAL